MRERWGLGGMFVLAAVASACAGGCADADGAGALAGDEQEMTEAPYLEVVSTHDSQGKKIVAHGLPAVSLTTTSAGSLVQAAMLVEQRSAAPGYVGYLFDERWSMGSSTGSEDSPLIVDPRTSPPTVTVNQIAIDRINAELKKDSWKRLVEHLATNNSVDTGSGWTVTYDGASVKYPRLHVLRDDQEILNKSAHYFGDNAIGPSGCRYAPELASAAISTQYKALVMRVQFDTSDAACVIADHYFTEALP